jgi:uncharacterized protein
LSSISRVYTVRKPWIAFGSGTAIGTLGGLIGLGGAEFRLPVLLSLFSLRPHRAVRFNLLVSLFTLLFACFTRLSLTATDELIPYAGIALAMAAGGTVSAWMGAGLLSRLPAGHLTLLIAALLLSLGLLLFAEGLVPIEPAALAPAGYYRLAIAVFAGFAIGAISSLLGVAGGEFIIPILIFIFGAGIKTAGTLSLMISVPVVAIGVARHMLTGHYRSLDVLTYLVLPMALGSIFGALMGAVLSATAPVAALKLLLGTILVLSALKLLNESHGR